VPPCVILIGICSFHIHVLFWVLIMPPCIWVNGTWNKSLGLPIKQCFFILDVRLIFHLTYRRLILSCLLQWKFCYMLRLGHLWTSQLHFCGWCLLELLYVLHYGPIWLPQRSLMNAITNCAPRFFHATLYQP